MSHLEAIYREYHACSEDFLRGIEHLEQRSVEQAIDYFKAAYASVSEDQ